ncbi:hypothetical protein [Treponema succinifaciens]|uniref:Uncharacterized protein n=1 Tax=Treponema succinifaciens (strain ATCC 33096 / DSM 2489 / 6091) TaxID=869209 RepID=F2NT51_TRES6|nr:hypothetical protein [Treponema succinifaciens]AEB14642.1 hypothetical protein Tresu_1751 [Treponema succinifaciens DSM 2489]
MKNNKKESYVKYGVLKQLRMTEQMENLIKSKALEHNTTESEIIRQALSNYINRSMSDSEIVHASLVENSRKIRYLENKVELLALIVMQQTKFIMKMFPNRQINSDEFVNIEYERFVRDCTKILKSNHSGVLESMILDAYEQGGDQS